MNKQFDVLVIGGGAAGLVSAKLVHELGKSVAIIEKDKLGGECTLTGCVPSKAFIHEVQTAKWFGVNFAKLNTMIRAYPTYCDIVKRGSRMCYIDKLQRNIFVKLAKKL